MISIQKLISSGLFNNLPSIPPSTMITCPETCPETAVEATNTTCDATSSGVATFLSGVLCGSQSSAISERIKDGSSRRQSFINDIGLLQCMCSHRCFDPT